MASEKELSGSVNDITEMVQALFELRDSLLGVSLLLKDTLATRDLAMRGVISAQSLALIQQLASTATLPPATHLNQPNPPAPPAPQAEPPR